MSSCRTTAIIGAWSELNFVYYIYKPSLTFLRPHVQFFCDIHYDPFLIMEDEKKVYGELLRHPLSLCTIFTIGPQGFTVSLYEYEATIPTLWNTVKDFLKENPGLTPEDNALGFLSDDGGETYNRCHCKHKAERFVSVCLLRFISHHSLEQL